MSTRSRKNGSQNNSKSLVHYLSSSTRSTSFINTHPGIPIKMRFLYFLSASSALVAAAPGYIPSENKDAIPKDSEFRKHTDLITNEQAKEEVEKMWPEGKEDADCLFWTGFPQGTEDGWMDQFKEKIKSKTGRDTVWFNEVIPRGWLSGWQMFLEDKYRQTVINRLSFAFADRCKGQTAWLLIPRGADTNDPYKGTSRKTPAVWVLFEQPTLTIVPKLKEIKRIDLDHMEEDIDSEETAFWKEGDGPIGEWKMPDDLPPTSY